MALKRKRPVPRPGDVLEIQLNGVAMNATVVEVRNGRVFVRLRPQATPDEDGTIDTFYRQDELRDAVLA